MFSNRIKSFFVKLAVAGGCLLLVAAAAACGGSEKGAPSSTAEPTLASTPGATPASTPEPVPTIDLGVPLVEYHSPDFGYSVSYPEGWVLHGSESSPVTVFSWSLDGRPIAQLTVLCNKGQGQSVDGLIAQDRAILSQYGATLPTESTPVEVGGLPGKQVTYTLGYSGLTVEQVAAYAAEGDSGWRIGLATYGSGSLEPSMPLFERIIASFRPD